MNVFSEPKVSFWLISICVACILITIAVIMYYFRCQRHFVREKSKHHLEMHKATITIQEMERKRFSEDLHDELGAILSIAKLKIDFFEKSNDKESLEDAKRMLEEAILSTRIISTALSPIILEKHGLVTALEDIAEKANITGHLKITFKNETSNLVLESEAELNFFRICQELLNNVIKYSQSTSILLQLIEDEDHVRFIIADNGNEFDFMKKFRGLEKKEGIGSKIIESRLKILNGVINYERKNNKNIVCISISKKSCYDC